jgi:Putative glutamine amidotransferase
MAGSSSLADGGWSASNMANLLPVVLPDHKNTFHRDPATAELTPIGEDSIITRLDEDTVRNEEHWKKLPYLMNYQDPGTPKPGAAVLADMTAAGRKMPLLVTENYGRGRTAVLASEGTWRWQMNLPVGDRTYKEFWQQLLRWLVADTPGPVIATVPSSTLYDDGRVQFSADVRDKTYEPLPDAQVEAHILGPGGIAAAVPLTQDPNQPGVFHGEFTADKPGTYTSEVVAKHGDDEIGRDVLAFERIDGVAESFHTEQNRELLQKLADETGGRYWQPADLPRLPSEVSFSDAGITTRETKDLWDMPIVFLLILALVSSEWLLRRKWGIV